MTFLSRKVTSQIVVLFTLLVLSFIPTQAQDSPFLQTYILNNNSGDARTEWFIEGERTMVMNGFDTTALNLPQPFTVNAVSIDVIQGVSDNPVEIVIYEDSTGGSPSDSRVIGRHIVMINQPGVNRIVLPSPAPSRSPIIWVGFHLPPGFRFAGDESGSSVLTYWAWTPDGSFNSDNLDQAAILGPADGTPPVNINMNGIARITAEVSPAVANTSGFTTETAPIGRQIPGPSDTDFTSMVPYPYCSNVFYDGEDLALSAGGAFTVACRADVLQATTGNIRNIQDAAEGIGGFERSGYIFDIFAGGNFRANPTDNERLRVPVTHCVRPNAEHLESAVLGIAYGVPKDWTILPTMRFGDLICAEVTHASLLSYFTPRSGQEATPDSNLMFIRLPRFLIPDTGCNVTNRIEYVVHNEGLDATPPTTVLVQIIHVRTGALMFVEEFTMDALRGGGTIETSKPFRLPRLFSNEIHQVVVTVDPGHHVAERNENDNVNYINIILGRNGSCLS